MYPLPDGVIPATPLDLPPPRVTMKLEGGTNSNTLDPLSLDKQYHAATVRCNRRITSSDWYQDVRQIEFTFPDEIRYDSILHLNSCEVIRSATTLETLQSSTRKSRLKV